MDGVPIFHASWDLKDAWVLCRQLGWQGVEAVKQSSYFGTRSRYYRYYSFHCTGSEESVLDCPKSEHYDRSSTRLYAAGVICTTRAQGANVTFQNVDDNSQSGLVHVNGRPVCDNGWDILDADVTCSSMGYEYVQHIIGSSFGASVQLPYSMVDVQCVGEEDSLPNCIHRHANESSHCNEGNGAGIDCSNKPKGVLIMNLKNIIK